MMKTYKEMVQARLAVVQGVPEVVGLIKYDPDAPSMIATADLCERVLRAKDDGGGLGAAITVALIGDFPVYRDMGKTVAWARGFAMALATEPDLKNVPVKDSPLWTNEERKLAASNHMDYYGNCLGWKD